jgi:hypothetical protein
VRCTKKHQTKQRAPVPHSTNKNSSIQNDAPIKKKKSRHHVIASSGCVVVPGRS